VSARLDLQDLPLTSLEANEWNPNVLDDRGYAAVVESIQMYGFVDPPVVQPLGDGRYRIVNGEHRVRAAREFNFPTLPCIVLEVDDLTAKRLTVILNEHGRADPARLSALLVELRDADPATFEMGLPYGQGELDYLFSLSDRAYELFRPDEESGLTFDTEDTVTLTFRCPPAFDQVWAALEETIDPEGATEEERAGVIVTTIARAYHRAPPPTEEDRP
jgi:ParB-like nuclease domain